MENNACQCRTNSSSACSTLDQQTFVNLTGASNESASQWTCCLCPLNTTYCCDKCRNISISPITGKEKVLFFLFFFCFVLQREISYRVGVVLKMKKPVWLNLADLGRNRVQDGIWLFSRRSWSICEKKKEHRTKIKKIQRECLSSSKIWVRIKYKCFHSVGPTSKGTELVVSSPNLKRLSVWKFTGHHNSCKQQILWVN